MAFTLAEFALKRPYLFHNTCDSNLDLIIHERCIYSTTSLVKKAPQTETFTRRKRPEQIQFGHRLTWLQTQRPLHEGHILFQSGWDLTALVRSLNEKVFFWPGKADGPIDYGKRHKKGNNWPSKAIVLRLPLQSLIDLGFLPKFCKYNSGSPRTTNGRKSPRGPNTFLPADVFEHAPANVVEVVFDSHVALPDTTEVWDEPNQRWKPIF
jgi:hypothetical protein